MPVQEHDTKVEELRQDVAELRNLIKKMMVDFKGAAKEEGGGLDDLTDRLHDGVASCKDAWADLRSRGKKAAAEAEKQIAERPLAAALIALMVGVAIGRAMSWRHR